MFDNDSNDIKFSVLLKLLLYDTNPPPLHLTPSHRCPLFREYSPSYPFCIPQAVAPVAYDL